MEEEILKIIMNAPFQQGEQRMAAKEITAHVFEFIEWVVINCYKMYNSGWYGVCDIDQTFNTLEKLYQYWKNEVKK
jgi:predicted P-loop ATPase/GTPase